LRTGKSRWSWNTRSNRQNHLAVCGAEGLWVEEDQYRATYNELTEVRCVFEKALTNNHARCSQSSHFWLADREGYACKCDDCSQTCSELLTKLREKSLFVLKLRELGGPLPHNMDIRVQVGGLRGLARLQAEGPGSEPEPGPEPGALVGDVHSLVSAAQDKYGAIEDLPFSEIMKSVVQFEGRRRRQKRDS